MSEYLVKRTKKGMNKEVILEEIIIGYRKVIETRYAYENIKDSTNLPPAFTEARAMLFQNYFLEYLYPIPAQRAKLDDAFKSLDDYIKHPEKLLRLLVDSTRLLFKYGRHLPKILKAGMKALQSFRKANLFETKLVEQAFDIALEPPYDEGTINILISTLSRQEIEDFLKSLENLFEILSDRPLVSKIKDIILHLIEKMEKRPKLYAKAEIDGLRIGYEIVNQGDLLFEGLDKDTQAQIFELIKEIEHGILEQIFEEEE